MTVSARLLAISCLVLCLPLAHAQDLIDPTRPPAAMNTRMEPTAGTQAGGLVLQSVLISPTRKAAIISGRTVALGEKLGDAKVVKITETEVVLRNGKEMQTLKLFPDIEKRPGAPRTKNDGRENQR